MSDEEGTPTCQWCAGDGCKSCGFTGRGDTHEEGCDCVGCLPQSPEGESPAQLLLLDVEAPARPDWALSPAEKRRNAARLREVRRGTGL